MFVFDDFLFFKMPLVVVFNDYSRAIWFEASPKVVTGAVRGEDIDTATPPTPGFYVAIFCKK
jgi:hypothetical protein